MHRWDKCSDALEHWGVEGSALLDADQRIEKVAAADIGQYIDLVDPDRFDLETLQLYVAPHRPAGRIRIAPLNHPSRYRDLVIVATKCHSSIRCQIGGNNVGLFVGSIGYGFHSNMSLFGDTVVCIGDRSTSNGVQIIAGNSSVILGRDCMLAAEVTIQSVDQHAVVDTTTLDILNNARARTLLGEHVWLGKRSLLLSNTTIGGGAIVAAGAIAKGSFPPCSIVGGVPAKVLRSNRSWFRRPHQGSAEEIEAIRRLSGAVPAPPPVDADDGEMTI